jgi:glycosyltransferase involved in cell wall biosynthesis
MMNINKQALINSKRLEYPPSWVGHIPFASWVIHAMEPKVFVELGTHSGNSYFAFCQSIQENALSTKAYAVDTWQGDEHAGLYDETIWQDVKTYNDENYEGFSTLIRKTFDDAVNEFENGSIDLLHIDGLHTYEAVKHDFETWLPKLSSRGVILFHDTVVKERGFGVYKLWGELEQQYSGFSFEHSHGLGVLLVGKKCDLSFKALVDDKEQVNSLKELFEMLGDKVFYAANMKQIVVDRDGQIAGLNEAVVNRDGQIAGLNEAVVNRNGQIVGLNETVADRDSQIAGLNNIISEYRDSMSWKVTKPLRWIKAQWRRIVKVVRLLVKGVRCYGGILNAVKKAVYIYKSEGASGIRRWAFRGSRELNEYERWVSQYDTLTDKQRELLVRNIEGFGNKPLVSIVMPVFNPTLKWLREAIESVQCQLYPNWELCIVDDLSTNPGVRKLLESISKKDSRIKVIYREKNGHISKASNSALKLAVGEWVALLDHDDVLSEHALYWVIDAINRHPNVRMIYSDEDKINESGYRHLPYFKCDWNPDLFYSHNMFCHLGVYARELLEEVGGFRVGMEGAQDYDLVLRCLERIDTSQIYHIPRILYHWRAHENSTARMGDAKPYAMLAGERALNEHFKSKRISAQAEITGDAYRVRYSLPEKLPLVSIVIPTKNHLKLIRQCVDSVLNKTSYKNYEILIVDNDSDEPDVLAYFDTLSAESRVRIFKDDRAFNYSQLNNSVVEKSKGEIICLMNNDIEVITPEWLSEMVSHALRPEIGVVGAKLLYPDNTLQHGGVVLGLGGVAGHSHKHFPAGEKGYCGRMGLISNFSAVTAACLVVGKEIYKNVGGLNETDLKVAFNDVDFCLRVREAGYRNIWTPYAELYHHESMTRGYEDTPEKQARFAQEVLYMKETWGTLLCDDPAYSPNLTLNHEDFSYAWPPRVSNI